MSSRVLIVEDELLIALDLQDTLEDDGHEVVGIARNMETALSLVGNASVALVPPSTRSPSSTSPAIRSS